MFDEYSDSESVFIFTTIGSPKLSTILVPVDIVLDMVTVKSVKSVISGNLFVMFLNIYLLT